MNEHFLNQLQMLHMWIDSCATMFCHISIWILTCKLILIMWKGINVIHELDFFIHFPMWIKNSTCGNKKKVHEIMWNLLFHMWTPDFHRFKHVKKENNVTCELEICFLTHDCHILSHFVLNIQLASFTFKQQIYHVKIKYCYMWIRISKCRIKMAHDIDFSQIFAKYVNCTLSQEFCLFNIWLKYFHLSNVHFHIWITCVRTGLGFFFTQWLWFPHIIDSKWFSFTKR